MARARALGSCLLALAALLPPLCATEPSFAAPPTKGRLPDWLLGEWTAVEVRQDSSAPYGEGDDPQHWFLNHVMTVTPDRLTFAMDACEVGSIRAKRASISVPVRHGTGVGLDAFGLPPEPKPVSYLAIQCARSLVDFGDGQGIVHDRVGSKIVWHVVARSPTEIDMPFLYGSYIKFRRASPTS